jgi:hypothetical protein
MSRIAQAVQRAVSEMRAGTDGTDEDVAGLMPADESEGGGVVAKKKRSKKKKKKPAAAAREKSVVRTGKQGSLVVISKDLPRMIGGLELLLAQTPELEENAAVARLLARAKSRL